MRACPVVTADVLHRVLHQSGIAAEERAALLRHLREPCEACLDLLEGHGADELLAGCLAPEELLSPAEQEQMFAAAAPAAGGEQAGGTVIEPRLARVRPLRRFAWGGAAAAAAILFGLLAGLRQPRQPTGDGGRKGLAAPIVALVPLVGSRAPAPHVVRALGWDSSLAPGELLLLRIRLSTPAWVYLLAQSAQGATELLWPLRAAAPHASGEFEVAEAGSVLAIDPVTLGEGARLVLVGCRERLDPGRLQIRDPQREHDPPAAAFPGCGVDVLPIRIGAH